MATQRVPLALVGASSKAHSPAQQSGRTINLYPEANGPDAKAIVALRAVPGQFRKLDLSEALPELALRYSRGLYQKGDRAFGAYGNKVVEFFQQGDQPNISVVYIVLTTLNTHTGPVGFSDNNGKLVIGDGAGFYTLDLDTQVLSPVIGDGDHLRGYWSLYLDGTTIYLLRDSSQYGYSAVGDAATIEGLWYVSAEADPDVTLAGFVVAGEMILLGENSTEWHRNYGEGDNPFQRIPGGRSEHGVVGKRAATEADNTVFMVGRNKDGAGQVMRLGGAGSAPQRVSNQAVEDAIAKVLFTSGGKSDDIIMSSYQEAGHTFIEVSLPAAEATSNNHAQPSKTWVYDAAMPPELGWHERGYMNPDTGRFERVLGDWHIFWKGRHYTGAYNAPHLYEQSLDYYRQNADPLVKRRQSGGPLNMGDRRFTVNKLGLMLETGIGRDSGVQGSDPQIILRYSWDDGKTWSNEIWRSVGKIGQHVEVTFGPAGSGRDFVVEVTYSEPTRFTLTGGWADVTVGR